MPGSVIVAGARTPIGKLSGALAGFSAMDLGGFAIAAALERAGVAPDQVDYVFMGQVLLAGQGQITARQAAAKAGIPMTVPATTVNKVCLSGLNAIYLADQMIAAGDAEIVVAGGMESMTQAPHLLPGARAGFRLGDATLVDSMMHDGLTCAFDQCAMGLSTERYNQASRHHPGAPGRLRRRLPREGGRGGQGRAAGRGDRPGRACPSARATRCVFDTDEGVRPGTTAESLGGAAAGLRQGRAPSPPATPRRSPTAGPRSSSCPGPRPTSSGVTPLGEFVSYGQVAGPDASLLHQPSRAISQALGKARVVGRRRRPLRDQRGLRRRRPGLGRRARHRRGAAQRERRGHRPRPPGRHVGHPGGADRPLRAAPARRRHGRGGPVRRRRPGRRPVLLRSPSASEGRGEEPEQRRRCPGPRRPTGPTGSREHGEQRRCGSRHVEPPATRGPRLSLTPGR